MRRVHVTDEEVLEYHERAPRGKTEVVPTKPSDTQRDLSLAYTPGVAVACRRIADDRANVWKYTGRGNLVAVVTNGTAVLGLGDIGPHAAKPVMEGKSVLFKRFGGVNAIDIEVDAREVDRFVDIVAALEPSFGGINLEDIKAPECFEIERRLRERMKIPVFHDDQHGTAVISGAGLLNAAELADKRLGDLKVVFSGAGAAAIACARLFGVLGVRRDRIRLCDSKGVVHAGRTEGMNQYKAEYAVATQERTLADALKGADVFVGCSVAGLVTPAMLKTMAPRPIIFALANPDPEIPYDVAREARPDALVATGRSDFPNQLNNVLGFPFIFRGALDVAARGVNDEMLVAAAHALAALAKEDVPDHVVRAYGGDALKFGPSYFVPKPLDPRVLLHVAPAVAGAAMASGIARHEIDLVKYREELEARLGKTRAMMRVILNKARKDPRRVVLAEGESPTIIRAAARLQQEGLAIPVLLGSQARIKAVQEEYAIQASFETYNPREDLRRDQYADALYRLRARRGVTLSEARALLRDPNVFGALMVHLGEADAFISGLTTHYPDALRPALQIIGVRPGTRKVSGLYMMTLKNRVFFFADATVNIEPTAEDLAEIALQAASVARKFNVTPRVAMLSFSNFGSAPHVRSDKVRRAVEIVKGMDPALEVDGEMQADTAVVPEILRTTYPFSTLTDAANVLIFPDLQSGNIAYKLLQRLADAEATGPILVGTDRPVLILQRGDDVEDVVNMAAFAVVQAQERDA